MKLKKKANAVRVPPLPKAIKVQRKASDSTETSTVHKALQNVKKVLEEQKTVARKKAAPAPVTKKLRPQKTVKRLKQKTRPREPRGIVYLGHLPHGFYEQQMEDYFKQFGRVTRVRVARSSDNGKSRGYGYVEFVLPDVAKIAAETMNNYLMCGRLLKATYIPPEKQHRGFFSKTNWSKGDYPKLVKRQKSLGRKNAPATEERHEKFVKKTTDKLSRLEKKLKENGIELNFQQIVEQDS